jgi:sirohydrochlorin ferrochelatase
MSQADWRNRIGFLEQQKRRTRQARHPHRYRPLSIRPAVCEVETDHIRDSNVAVPSLRRCDQSGLRTRHKADAVELEMKFVGESWMSQLQDQLRLLP